MKKIALIAFIGSLSFQGISQTTTFDQLNANYGYSKKIEWFTSGSANGYGHKIYNSDPGGKTLLTFAGRHNNSSWTDIMTFTSSGFVGLGTNNPQYGKFQINALSHSDNALRLQIGRFSMNGTAEFSIDAVGIGGGRLIVQEDGKVGINTNSPDKQLDVNGEISWGNSGAALTMNQGAAIELRGTGIPFIDFSNDPSIDYDMRLILMDNDWLNFGGGSVGIGVSSVGPHKLAVEGSIGAREVKVQAGPGWPDFVFENGYELRTLEEVEEHINENGYLPEIPSDAEVTENGINLGEMNAKLLQKIEELTLYLIEQNKQNQTQQAEIEALKAKIDQLENK